MLNSGSIGYEESVRLQKLYYEEFLILYDILAYALTKEPTKLVENRTLEICTPAIPLPLHSSVAN